MMETISKQPINFIAELEKLKEPVWEQINKYLPDKEPRGHYEMVRDYPERKGKYFRPGLLLLSADMFGSGIDCLPPACAGRAQTGALLAAAAMQVSEDWLLIHDDFEDHSEKRRGKRCLNKIFGDELAVNAGDALHIIMWKILGANARNCGGKGWMGYDKMNDIALTTTEGQFMELDWIREGRIAVPEEEYYKMIYIKAGYYTVTGPLQIGAICAGADDGEIKKIEEWGVPFGCAFQIWDDIMNLTVPSEKQGKERGGDILEGKRTLSLIHLLKCCSQKEKAFIEDVYLKKRGNKTEEEKERIIELMEKYKSIEYAKGHARKAADEAERKFIASTSHLPDTRAKEIIKAGILFVVDR